MEHYALKLFLMFYQNAHISIFNLNWSHFPCVTDVALTSDFIAGFCGETETAHLETLELIKDVEYSMAFCFPYSMRQVGPSLLSCNGIMCSPDKVSK